jgi:hypothetical protein
MTFYDHMMLKYIMMNVRDDLQDRFRHDAIMQDWVRQLNECLAVLNRRSLREALIPEEDD